MLEKIEQVEIRTNERACEVSWFDDICGGDTVFLGTVDPTRRSNYEHCSNIMKTAEKLGFNNNKT